MDRSQLLSAKQGKHQLQSNLLSPCNGALCHLESRAWVMLIELFSTTAIKADNAGCGMKPRLGKSIRYINIHCTCAHTKTCTHTSEHLKRLQRFDYEWIRAHMHANTLSPAAFKRHLPSCDHEAFRCYPPMNIKYKHSSKFSTPGLYFMPLSWHNKHISFSLPNSCS